VFYGWVIVAVAALQQFFSGPGQTYSISNFVQQQYVLATEDGGFGWSQGTVGSLYGSATMVSGLTMWIVGRAVDRFGPRRATLVVSCCFVLTCLYNSLVWNKPSMWFGFLALRFFGQGSMYLISSVVIAHWFVRHRGRAYACAGVGGFLSAVVFPPVDTALLACMSWRSAWRLWAAALLFVFVPVAALFYFDTPAHLGLRPDGGSGGSGGGGSGGSGGSGSGSDSGGNEGETKGGGRKASTSQSTLEGAEGEGEEGGAGGVVVVVAEEAEDGEKEEEERSATLGEALRHPSFYLLLWLQFESSAVNTAITFDMVPIMRARGVSTIYAATVLSVQAMVGFPVTFGVGFLTERVAVEKVLAVTYLWQLLAVLALLKLTHSFGGAVAFACIWGLAAGFEQICLQLIFPRSQRLLTTDSAVYS
jgi:MFS family permease